MSLFRNGAKKHENVLARRRRGIVDDFERFEELFQQKIDVIV